MAKLLLLLFSGLKFSKVFVTGGSMLVSVGAYALIFGWRYAAGFVLLKKGFAPSPVYGGRLGWGRRRIHKRLVSISAPLAPTPTLPRFGEGEKVLPIFTKASFTLTKQRKALTVAR